MGPVAGALIELVKILLNLLIRGTSTAGVGDLGNFLIGCAMCIPASLIYQRVTFSQGCDHRYGNRNCFMTIVGCFINAYLLLPAYAAAFHMPIDALVAMGTAVNSHINSLLTFVLLSVAPFNLLKGFPGIIDRIPDLQKDQPDFTNGTRIDYNFTKQQKGFVMSLFFMKQKQREVFPRRHSSLC